MKKNREAKYKFKKRQRRMIRTRARIGRGTEQLPRLTVFRSLKHIYAQIINDERSETIIGFSDKNLENVKGLKKIEIAREVGKEIAKKAQEKNIERVIFDRGRFLYHGRIKALAEGAREGGLKF